MNKVYNIFAFHFQYKTTVKSATAFAKAKTRKDLKV